VKSLILHIATRSDWDRSEERGSYRCLSLRDEGFIHCSTLEQLLIPANERFRGQQDLVLLCIEAQRLGSELLYEDCYDSGMDFPHVYGPIERHAVIDVLDFVPGEDGYFQLPESLKRL
jgi:uncharacterized protein (DUF952 family)